MGIVESFRQNFIEHDRWKLMLSGLKTTLVITLFAVVLGLILGFLVAIIRSTHDKTGKLKILNVLSQIYLTIIRGTPTVVQLLISYFIIFATAPISKTVVAIITFGVNSGAYVAEIVRSGIMSVDNGQIEAGRSLGFSYRQTMFSIVLPQALKNVLPALGNEFIVLLKETSVAGYIAIDDITKAGDTIRSQTYSPFFPLIAVAIFYLVLVMILSYFVRKLERRLATSDRG